VLAVFGALAAGCVASGSAGRPDPGAASGYLPMRPGSSWTYRVSDERGRSADRVARVEGLAPEDAGSADPVFLLRWDLLDGAEILWAERTPTGVACVQAESRDAGGMVTTEDAYDPPETIVDERPDHLAAGAKWSETFVETAPNYKGHPRLRNAVVKWTVEATDERVTVPAGTFTCLRVRRTRKHRAPATYWFARGVGLVKETGAGPLGDETLALVRADSAAGHDRAPSLAGRGP
jgi:hypothetical protein